MSECNWRIDGRTPCRYVDPAVCTVWAVAKSQTWVTHARLAALRPGLPGWAGTRKVKLIWILLKQETVSGSGMTWASLQTDNHASTPPLSFYRPDALPATQPTASKHWRQTRVNALIIIFELKCVPMQVGWNCTRVTENNELKHLIRCFLVISVTQDCKFCNTHTECVCYLNHLVANRMAHPFGRTPVEWDWFPAILYHFRHIYGVYVVCVFKKMPYKTDVPNW